jgi:hypothetical protein
MKRISELGRGLNGVYGLPSSETLAKYERNKHIYTEMHRIIKHVNDNMKCSTDPDIIALSKNAKIDVIQGAVSLRLIEYWESVNKNFDLDGILSTANACISLMMSDGGDTDGYE